jgi:hypothetical protein
VHVCTPDRTYSGFGVVQPDTTRQSPLGQEPQLRDDDLVNLFGNVSMALVRDSMVPDGETRPISLPEPR